MSNPKPSFDAVMRDMPDDSREATLKTIRDMKAAGHPPAEILSALPEEAQKALIAEWLDENPALADLEQRFGRKPAS